MHLHAVRQRRHLLVEAVPPGDLERDQAHLPGAAGHRQRALDPAHVQHPHGAGAQRHRPADRDRVNQPAVEVVPAVHLHRGQQPGDRARREHGRHDRPVAEPPRGGILDAGRDAVERDGQGWAKRAAGQGVVQHVAQRLDRVQVGPGAGPAGPPGPTSSRGTPAAAPRPARSSASRGAAAEPGSAATTAPLIAPTDVPTTRSGRYARLGPAPAACPPRARQAAPATKHERRLHRLSLLPVNLIRTTQRTVAVGTGQHCAAGRRPVFHTQCVCVFVLSVCVLRFSV